MGATKSTLTKKPKAKPVVERHDENEEEVLETKTVSAKKPIELDIPDETAPLDDKEEGEASDLLDDMDDSTGDDAALDEEELNPFGDKWEQ